MNQWLTIHWPPPDDGRPRLEYDNKVYLKTQNSYRRHEIKKGDIGFVYETVTSPKKVQCSDVNGKEKTSYKPRTPLGGGIVAAGRIKGEFIVEEYLEKSESSSSHYTGYFEMEIIYTGFVGIDILRKNWEKEFGKSFQPRINGGLRWLSPQECEVLSRLIGLSEVAE